MSPRRLQKGLPELLRTEPPGQLEGGLGGSSPFRHQVQPQAQPSEEARVGSHDSDSPTCEPRLTCAQLARGPHQERLLFLSVGSEFVSALSLVVLGRNVGRNSPSARLPGTEVIGISLVMMTTCACLSAPPPERRSPTNPWVL